MQQITSMNAGLPDSFSLNALFSAGATSSGSSTLSEWMPKPPTDFAVLCLSEVVTLYVCGEWPGPQKPGPYPLNPELLMWTVVTPIPFLMRAS